MQPKRQTMCPPSYYQSADGLMISHVTVHHVPKCMSHCHAIGGLVITTRVHCLSFWLHMFYAHLTSAGFEDSVNNFRFNSKFFMAEFGQKYICP